MEKWDAALYEEMTDELLERRKKLIEEYRGRMKWDENEQVLDIGCGPGSITAKVILPFLSRSSKLVGFDKCKEMIQYAKTQYKELEFVNGDLVENITELVGKDRFTKVFSFLAFHWILEQRNALENIKKIMKPGGEALIEMICDSGVYQIHESMSKQPKWRKYMLNKYAGISPYYNITNPEELFAELLESVGFTVIECTTRPFGESAPSLESLKKRMKTIDMFINQVPQKLHEEYMDECMQCGLALGWIKNVQYPNEMKYFLSAKVIVGFFRKPTI